MVDAGEPQKNGYVPGSDQSRAAGIVGIRNHSCPFCAPAADEVIFETVEALVLTDARPLCAGHVLVLPKAHVPAAMEAPHAAALFELAQAVAGVLTEVMGEAGIYEHGGHPLCRHGSCRSGPVHAHLHVLPFREDITELWTEGAAVGGRADDRAETHYLLQAISNDPPESIPLPAAVFPHFIRTLLSRAMTERRLPWLPAGAPPLFHRRATLTTLQMFDGIRFCDDASEELPRRQAA